MRPIEGSCQILQFGRCQFLGFVATQHRASDTARDPRHSGRIEVDYGAILGETQLGVQARRLGRAIGHVDQVHGYRGRDLPVLVEVLPGADVQTPVDLP